MTVVRAASHLHSDWSDDGSWTLTDLAAGLGERGYDVLLMTEHSRGWSAERWQEFRGACAEVSSDRQLVVPGIEYNDPDNVVHVLVWGDDQDENFSEDGVPAFCVFALDQITSRPFARKGFYSAQNVWGEPPDTVFRNDGHVAGASFVAANLLKRGFDVAYAYAMRYELGLPHAFINTLLYLDFDRKGFPYPVVPFHVNCYGSSVIAHTSCSTHRFAIVDISSRVSTRPVGLCGVLTMIAFVRLVNALRRRSGSMRQSGFSIGTNTGVAPARIASGP